MGRLGFHRTPWEDVSPTAVICSLCSFGLWYQDSSKDPPTSSSPVAWEVIDSLDTQLEPEGDPAASSPDRAVPPP